MCLNQTVRSNMPSGFASLHLTQERQQCTPRRSQRKLLSCCGWRCERITHCNHKRVGSSWDFGACTLAQLEWRGVEQRWAPCGCYALVPLWQKLILPTCMCELSYRKACRRQRFACVRWERLDALAVRFSWPPPNCHPSHNRRHLKPHHHKWRIRASAAHARLDTSYAVAFVPIPDSGVSAPCMYISRILLAKYFARVLNRLVSEPWSPARYPLHLRRNIDTIRPTPFQMLSAVLMPDGCIQHDNTAHVMYSQLCHAAAAVEKQRRD